MNISIFDLYQEPKDRIHSHIGPYVYQSPLLSPEPCFDPEPLSPVKATAVSLHPSRLPTRSRRESQDWNLDEMVEVLIEGAKRGPKLRKQRASNVLQISHSYAENQTYWKGLRKRIGEKPNYKHRRYLSGDMKPPLPVSRPQYSLNSSLCVTKLSRLQFDRKVHKEEALRALGFSMRSRRKAVKLRESLERQEEKIKSRVSPVLTPMDSGKHRERRLNASLTLPKPARFNPSTFLFAKPPRQYSYLLNSHSNV